MGEIRFELRNAKPSMVTAFMSTVMLVAGGVIEQEPYIERSHAENSAVVSIRSDGDDVNTLAKTLFKEFGTVVDPSIRAVSSSRYPDVVGFIFEPKPSQRKFGVIELKILRKT